MSIPLADLANIQEDGTIWHYTNIEGFQGILKDRKIRATDARFLNDWKEFVHALDTIDKIIASPNIGNERSAIRDIFQDSMALARRTLYTMNIPFVCSFSRSKNSLSQWRAYGQSMGGYSLGFDLSCTRAACRHLTTKIFEETKGKPYFEYYLIDVLYDEEIQNNLFDRFLGTIAELIVDQAIDLTDSNNRNGLMNVISQFVLMHAAALKDKSFEDEREVRLLIQPRPQYQPSDASPIKFRPGAYGITPFVEFDFQTGASPNPMASALKEVIIGPTPYVATTVTGAAAFCKASGYHNIKPIYSKIPIR